MNQPLFILAIFISLPFNLSWAQGGRYFVGGRTAGLSDASVTLRDSYSFFHNPAALAFTEGLTLSGAYHNRSGWEGVHTAAASVAGNWRGLGWGAGAYRFGDAIYREQWLGMGVGYHMGLASVGAKINWLQYAIENFGRRHVPMLEVGGWAEITPHWQVGGYLSNLNLARLSQTTGERVPTLMKLGLAHLPLPNLTLLAEVQQALGQPTVAILAVEYAPLSHLWLRSGAQLTHRNFSLGLGYQAGAYRIDYGLMAYANTGLGHQLSLSRPWHLAKP